MNRKAATICLLLFALLATVVFVWPKPTVDSVMADFFHNDGQRAEDMLMDPLILHADLVTTRVIEEIKDPDMVKRRYAIGFLGIVQATNALPVLGEIVNSDREIDYFRADALESIYRISSIEGLSLAEQYRDRDDYLGHIAMGLINGGHTPFEHTYSQAQVGHHE